MTWPKWATPKLVGTTMAAVAAGLLWLGWAAALSPGDRLSALERRMDAVEGMGALVEALSRDRCLEDYERAQLAGLPCRKLVDRPLGRQP